MAKLRIAVIGGGPGGLSAAQFILEAGHEAVVFERENRIGGKSFSFVSGDAFNEMGTCYTTRQHVIVKRWMKAHNIQLRRLGEARYDDAPVVDYVKKGGGGPLVAQGTKFLLEAGRLKGWIARSPGDAGVAAEAAMPVAEWLAQFNLPKLDLAMHRLLAAQGYGYPQEVTIGQTVQWCDLDLLISGVLNDMHMPVEGWSEFWIRFSKRFDVRLESEIQEVDRSDDRVTIVTGQGSERFDGRVCADDAAVAGGNGGAAGRGLAELHDDAGGFEELVQGCAGAWLFARMQGSVFPRRVARIAARRCGHGRRIASLCDGAVFKRPDAARTARDSAIGPERPRRRGAVADLCPDVEVFSAIPRGRGGERLVCGASGSTGR
jgi:hypothetical protein